jgi:hypothetical protein
MFAGCFDDVISAAVVRCGFNEDAAGPGLVGVDALSRQRIDGSGDCEFASIDLKNKRIKVRSNY